MSSIAWGILAWALVGADKPEPPAAKATYSIRIVRAGGDVPAAGRFMSNVGIGQKSVEPEQIGYEVQVVTTPAAEWRETFYRHCKRVGREGRSTVWTIDEKTAAEMMTRMSGAHATNVLMAPKVTSFAGVPATVNARHIRTFVVDMDRLADGPADHAGKIAFQPSAEQVAEGVTVSLNGKRTADGVRAHVMVESTWVGHVAKAMTSETIENKRFGKTSISAPLDLPQVVEAMVDGDYEIPAGRQMLASLGTATTVDDRGKPVVMERLLLIAARPILTEDEEARIDGKPTDAAVRAASVEACVANRAYADVMASVKDSPAPAPIWSYNDASLDGSAGLRSLRAPEPAPKRMPPLPSRTPLQPVGPDGKVVELPPLPEGFDAVADAADPSAGPQASPQTRAGRPAWHSVDAKVAPARLDPEPVGRSPIRLDGRELASGRTQVLRIPLGGSLAIELQARVVPAEKE
ncbi:MAG TPA: hypothetical protein VGH33_08595 [Isosphaeraceae bacterium]|jgi:hypothetical protein